ncbi:hypothetical protein Poli38472_000766 [Pythium oligandrum]|uniref:Kinesin motor domain-containing protein n=1 Tax=Pythium oligandrum TaxID=41045 RepID=A0A8K1CCW1_PYTOL|nr:hypothetical protein Poli38472_000766 [Pythium oligandrum]|eukprot:TMW60724.1 hypothetical protein Poli38472_000766 [Pythium oligandrum]
MDTVKVCVRIRPLNAKERQEQTKSCIRIAASLDGLTSNNRSSQATALQQLIVGKDRAFTFDTVFGIESSQEEIYRNSVAPLVEGFLEGYNATVLAYGQTGTGKTHTMSGTAMDAKGGRNEDLQGIIPRVVRTIFTRMQEQQQRVEYNLRVEYIEIYNEELRDLLHPETTSKQLSIREDGEGNIVTSGVKSEVAQSKEAVFRLLSLGGASRVTASTLMNEQSSRSHAIFSLILQQRDQLSGECRKAKFHLVDLAGSERAKRTGAVAGRFKESISINQGLLALGNVISALSDEKKRQNTSEKSGGGGNNSTTTGGGTVHVPYRDSKLTRLLQDSLGGNAKTLMIACVSPATINFEETLNTLKYANRAKNIKNRPIVNQQTQEEKQKAEEEISRMKEEIALLQSQLQRTYQPSAPGTASSSSSGRPETASSSSSASSANGRRRHSVATVSTSTAASLQDAAAEQELQQLKKKCRTYTETIESMRTHSVEAIAGLISMERDIKPLGRPVQQRLNEIVKLLNAAIQSANTAGNAVRKSHEGTPSPSRPETDGPDDEDETIRRLHKELKDAKADLARDEQIFEMKNGEIQRLQQLVTAAKAKNEKLIQRVQELERGGQLWSNAGTASTAVLPPSNNIARRSITEQETQGVSSSRCSTSVERAASRDGVASKPLPLSRGLFTKRGGTASFEPEEDKVLIGTEEDEQTMLSKSRNQGLNTQKTPGTARSTTAQMTTGRRSSLGMEGREEMISPPPSSKLEKMVSTLRAKVEELQQQNGELQHGREESTHRWQLERQQYERQINEAEQTIEALRKANQSLEDTVLNSEDAVPRRDITSARRHRGSKASLTETVIDEEHEVSIEMVRPQTSQRPPKTASSRPSTAKTSVREPVASEKEILELYEDSIRRLLEYHQARQHVLQLTKDKKAAQSNKDEAHRRLNALEMQKMRQSLSLRESIADVSQSLQHINEKMQRENKTLEEIERLTKLKERAERKLKTLRRQEEKGEFIDKEGQQEMADLEELVEDLTSHIAFQDAELATAREDLELIKQRSQVDQESPLDSMAQTMCQQLGISDGAGIALALIKKCLNDIARLRVRERELLNEVEARGHLIEEREAALHQLETGLQAARKEFDRRLQLQQQETEEVVRGLEQQVKDLNGAHEEQQRHQKLQPQTLGAEDDDLKDQEWQKLIISCQKKDEYITDLEKHVVFYKSKAKQMQMQLQQLIRDSVGNQDDHSDVQEDNLRLQKRIQQLEEANDALMKDLATAKVYLRLSKNRSSAEGSPSTQVVRVSKSELRELPRPPTSSRKAFAPEE